MVPESRRTRSSSAPPWRWPRRRSARPGRGPWWAHLLLSLALAMTAQWPAPADAAGPDEDAAATGSEAEVDTRPGRLRVEASGVAEGVPVDVRVDGEAVGRAPVVVERPPGRYRVELGADGFYPATDEVEVTPGGEVTRSLQLDRIETQGSRFWGWTLIGAGVVLLGGATALHFASADEFDKATTEGIPYPVADAHRTTGINESVGSFALYGVGGMAITAGLALILLADVPVPRDGWDGDESPTVSVGPGSILLQGRF